MLQPAGPPKTSRSFSYQAACSCKAQGSHSEVSHVKIIKRHTERMIQRRQHDHHHNGQPPPPSSHSGVGATNIDLVPTNISRVATKVKATLAHNWPLISVHWLLPTTLASVNDTKNIQPTAKCHGPQCSCIRIPPNCTLLSAKLGGTGQDLL